MIPAEECYFRGRVITSLTREELLEVCRYAFTQEKHYREERERLVGAVDWTKYLQGRRHRA